ncbi:MAG: ThiF family adenylyltransferase [Henriciella sp.]|nr:ThiF family adenylyltransferase [Henriciella sp.]
MPLLPTDIERHKRHILLKEIGGPGVQKLRAATVTLVGAGALGGPCALFLAAAGVGAIEIWDDDRVDLSNLQRQVQFSETDIDKPKADCLKSRIIALNRDCQVTARQARFEDGSTPSGDILIDASDNFETRFRLNRVAHSSGRFLVSGAASRWDGQVSVFASGRNPHAPCYQCFVPEMPPEAEACDEVGVVGALTGQVGAAMAMEAIKLITGAGEPLIGRLLIFDGLQGTTRTLKLRPDTDCLVCQK